MNYSDATFDDKDIKREYFRHRIASDFREAFRVACRPEERDAFLRLVLNDIGYGHVKGLDDSNTYIPTARTGLPIEAPARWSERGGRQAINPVEFTLQHYRPWIGRGLERSHIRQLDFNLYHALNKWIRRHPDDQAAIDLSQAIPDRAMHAAQASQSFLSTPDNAIDQKLATSSPEFRARVKSKRAKTERG